MKKLEIFLERNLALFVDELVHVVALPVVTLFEVFAEALHNGVLGLADGAAVRFLVEMAQTNMIEKIGSFLIHLQAMLANEPCTDIALAVHAHHVSLQRMLRIKILKFNFC